MRAGGVSDCYPPGVTDADIDRAFGHDPRWERMMECLPPECPGCGQNVFPAADENANAHGLGAHIEVNFSSHQVAVVCNGPVINADGEPEPLECETTLYAADCRCPECDPREDEHMERRRGE